MTRTDLPTKNDKRAASRTSSPTFTVLTALAGLTVLLQGVWAGLFIHEGQDFQHGWVEVHSRGAEVAIVLAAAASIVAIVKLRSRPWLVAGGIVFTLLLVLESFLGGLIGDAPAVSAVHIPLALLLMAMAVALPLRAART